MRFSTDGINNEILKPTLFYHLLKIIVFIPIDFDSNIEK